MIRNLLNYILYIYHMPKQKCAFNSCNKKVCNWLDWFSKLKIPLKILKEKSRRKNTNNIIKYKFENEAKIVEANISDSLFATKLKFFK